MDESSLVAMGVTMNKFDTCLQKKPFVSQFTYKYARENHWTAFMETIKCKSNKTHANKAVVPKLTSQLYGNMDCANYLS